ncbi:MAG: response regulator transcription factor [Pedobacter sp.]|nr:MAG: response regulator transcription factor [Pedobacter sp.]
MLKIILAEDHKIVRNGIRILLEGDLSLSIVGEAENGQQVLDLLKSGVKADIILADINMPVMDGMEILKAVKTIAPKIRVVMLSMLDNEKYVAQSFSEGAAGYLLKNASADELIFALKHVGDGNRYLYSELAINMLDKFLAQPEGHADTQLEPVEFSMREIEILQLIAEGYTNNEMSEKLFISKRTIEGHRQNLLDKTSSRNTAALIKFAVLHGYLH